MENKKAKLLWSLKKELLKYEKSSKILKKDVICDNLIMYLHKIKEAKLEQSQILYESFADFETFETFDKFNERFKEFSEIFYQLQEVSPKKINELKAEITESKGTTAIGLTLHFAFYLQCKYKTPLFLELQYYFPKLIDLQIHEIIFWILNVELKDPNKKIKNSNYFLTYVKEIKEKKNNENIKESYINLLTKIIKHIKYGQKS